jgi:hypothetical protein
LLLSDLAATATPRARFIRHHEAHRHFRYRDMLGLPFLTPNATVNGATEGRREDEEREGLLSTIGLRAPQPALPRADSLWSSAS